MRKSLAFGAMTAIALSMTACVGGASTGNSGGASETAGATDGGQHNEQGPQVSDDRQDQQGRQAKPMDASEYPTEVAHGAAYGPEPVG